MTGECADCGFHIGETDTWGVCEICKHALCENCLIRSFRRNGCDECKEKEVRK